MPMLCSWQRVSTEEDFFLPDYKDQQELTASMHQVDHVIAEKHGGQTAIENLALSCTV
jgi:5-methylcytosine-specific restriction endonuclease McrA